jgi:hypothetical protein
LIGFALTDASTPVWLFGALRVVFGLSLGLWQQVVIVAAQNAAPPKDIGVATGLITQSRAMGGSLGLALNGAVAAWALTAHQAQLSPAISALLPGGLPGITPATIAALPEAARAAVLDGFTGGFHAMFLFAAGVFCLALVMVMLLRDLRIEKAG